MALMRSIQELHVRVSAPMTHGRCVGLSQQGRQTRQDFGVVMGKFHDEIALEAQKGSYHLLLRIVVEPQLLALAPMYHGLGVAADAHPSLGAKEPLIGLAMNLWSGAPRGTRDRERRRKRRESLGDEWFDGLVNLDLDRDRAKGNDWVLSFDEAAELGSALH